MRLTMKRSSGDSNSHSAVQPPTLQKKHVQKSPSHLYLKGNVWYFRYCFPPKLKEILSRGELRLSLATAYICDARRYATALVACLENIIMTEKTPDIAKIKAELKDKLDEFLSHKDASPVLKHPPSVYEIRRRMNNWLLKRLKDIDENIEKPEGFFTSYGAKKLSPEEGLDYILKNFINPLYESPERMVNILFPTLVKKLIEEKIFRPEELTPSSVLQILDENGKVEKRLNEIQRARLHDDYEYEKKFIDIAKKENLKQLNAEPSIDYGSPASQSMLPESKQSGNMGLLLSELLEKYVEIKLSDGKWKIQDLATYKNRISTVIEILGDIPAESVTRDMMRQCRDTLRKLPPQRTHRKEFRDKTIKELVEMNLPDNKTFNIKTINMMIEAFSGMFQKAIQEGWLNININPASKLQIEDNRLNIDLRTPFTQEEINTLFFSGDFKIEKFKHPSFYWVPLIAILSGMRLEEICQLYCEDIQKDKDGIWYFDIKATDSQGNSTDKRVKNKNATRYVPIHDYLIKNKFIEYVEKVKNEGHVRIFHELKKSTHTYNYGKQVGKAFSEYLKKKNMKNKRTTFHSLRHSFADYFNKRGLNNDIFLQIFGHENSKLSVSLYGSRFTPKQCYEAIISKLDWIIKK